MLLTLTFEYLEQAATHICWTEIAHVEESLIHQANPKHSKHRVKHCACDLHQHGRRQKELLNTCHVNLSDLQR